MKSPVKAPTAEEIAAQRRKQEEQKWNAQVSERSSSNSAATAKARAVKLDRLARTNPMIAELVAERDALASADQAFNAERQKLENDAADLRSQLEALTAENATLKAERSEHVATVAALREQLAAAKAELDSANRMTAEAQAQRDGQAREIEKLRDQLAAAKAEPKRK